MDKFIKRLIWDRILGQLKKEEITVILGPRQVGKTTLLFELINHLKKQDIAEQQIYFYSFDDVDLRAKIKSICS